MEVTSFLRSICALKNLFLNESSNEGFFFFNLFFYMRKNIGSKISAPSLKDNGNDNERFESDIRLPRNDHQKNNWQKYPSSCSLASRAPHP